MREIAATQAAAGQAPALFESMAEICASVATGELARSPEEIRADLVLDEVLERLRDR
jgi:hypothetical protein